MHIINRTADPCIVSKVIFITAPMSNPYAMPYSLAAKTLRIIRLHFIDDFYMIFTLLIALVRQII